MKKIILLFLFVFPLVYWSCEETTPTPPDNNDQDFSCEENQEVCELTADNNAFGFELIKRLHEEEADENIFISPLSISAALAMTVNGAKGETKAEMLEAMQLEGWSVDQMNEAYRVLLNVLPLLDDDVKLEIANSIWYKLGYNILPEFLEVNSVYYSSETNEIDFSDPGAKDIINGWVEDNTNGLIEEMIDQIPSNIVMYLINAIYFKGIWLKQFEAEDTKEELFFSEDGSSEKVEMMKFDGEISLPYFEMDKFQAVDLAYGDSIFSMSLFLPKQGYTIDDLIDELNTQNWDTWINAFTDQNIMLQMPKFSMEYEKKLNEVLKALGMERAFTFGADFSGINGTGGLMISRVKHKSFIEVNEEGTEAAAVTVVEIIETSVPQVPFFNANSPYLFVIRDKKTNSILFIGKMMNPNK